MTVLRLLYNELGKKLWLRYCKVSRMKQIAFNGNCLMNEVDAKLRIFKSLEFLSTSQNSSMPGLKIIMTDFTKSEKFLNCSFIISCQPYKVCLIVLCAFRSS